MQNWNAERYGTHAGYVPEFGAAVLGLLAPRAGERILDLGCGDGALTVSLAEAGATVVAVDASPEMVAAACARGLDARVMDGQALAFEGEFDAVFSNAALHWMREPDRVLAGVHRALRPGGRFVAEFGGHGNVAAITVALLAVLGQHGVAAENAIPWYLPTAEAYRQRLEAHGFAVPDIALMPRPTPLPTDVAGWMDTFAGPFFAHIPEGERTIARDEAVALLRPVLRDDQGRWFADYVRLRFLAMRGD